jgi:hypothetical protein
MRAGAPSVHRECGGCVVGPRGGSPGPRSRWAFAQKCHFPIRGAASTGTSPQPLDGLLVLFIARRRTTATRAGRIPVLIVIGLAAMFQALAFLDAATAYSGHGPYMVIPAVTLFACVAAEVVLGVVGIAAGIRRWPGPVAGTAPAATDR